MQRRRGDKRQRTRARLIDVAFRLFEKKGYEAATVEEIARAAQVTSRTFFRYFTSKEDLVLLGQDEEHRALEVQLKARSPRQTPLEFLLRANPVLAWTPAQRDRVKQSWRLIRETPALRNRERGRLSELEDILATGLTPARATRAEKLRIRLLVATYLAAASTVMNAYLEGDLRGEPADHLHMVGELLRYGFGPRDTAPNG